MSLVTATEHARCLALLGSGSPQRDELLHSLARKLTWTTKQRELVETIWNEERAKRKEHAMTRAQGTTAVLMAVALVGLTGCMTTYEKRFTDHEGREIVMRETHEKNPFINWFAPDWMNVRHERITRDGKVITSRTCVEDYETMKLLTCEPTLRVRITE